jgi:hypothetical protein
MTATLTPLTDLQRYWRSEVTLRSCPGELTMPTSTLWTDWPENMRGGPTS